MTSSIWNRNLFVKNIKPYTSEKALRSLFESFGKVDCVRTGAKDFGFVRFENPNEAAIALAKLNGFQWRNNTIFVQYDYKNWQKTVVEFDRSVLPQKSPKERLEYLGEHLYPRVEKIDPHHAPQITGRLLQRELPMQIEMCENQNALRKGVEEEQAQINAEAAVEDKADEEKSRSGLVESVLSAAVPVPIPLPAQAMSTPIAQCRPLLLEGIEVLCSGGKKVEQWTLLNFALENYNSRGVTKQALSEEHVDYNLDVLRYVIRYLVRNKDGIAVDADLTVGEVATTGRNNVIAEQHRKPRDRRFLVACAPLATGPGLGSDSGASSAEAGAGAGEGAVIETEKKE